MLLEIRNKIFYAGIFQEFFLRLNLFSDATTR